MSTFLNRKVACIPMWVWLALCSIAALYFRTLLASLVFVAPAIKALRDGAHEMNQKAQEMLDRIQAQQLSDKTVDETIDETADEAKLKAILNYKEKQDDVHDPYMD